MPEPKFKTVKFNSS